MMPLQMMRSAPPDFGDHGRTIGAIAPSGINGRPKEGLGGLAGDGEYIVFFPCASWPRRSTGRRGHPHALPYDGWKYLYIWRVCMSSIEYGVGTTETSPSPTIKLEIETWPGAPPDGGKRASTPLPPALSARSAS